MFSIATPIWFPMAEKSSLSLPEKIWLCLLLIDIIPKTWSFDFERNNCIRYIIIHWRFIIFHTFYDQGLRLFFVRFKIIITSFPPWWFIIVKLTILFRSKQIGPPHSIFVNFSMFLRDAEQYDINIECFADIFWYFIRAL